MTNVPSAWTVFGRRERVAVIVFALLVPVYVAGAVWGVPRWKETALRRALPHSAKGVREHIVVDRYPNSTLYLKARLSKQAFAQYARTLKLAPAPPNADVASVSTPGNWAGTPLREQPAWWNPSPDHGNDLHWQDEHRTIIAKYEHGCVFVLFDDFAGHW